MFVRNCWYMAGWSRDFARDELKPVTMLNEAIVLYRKSDGGLVALQDRCCHRFAPLSLGRIEHDNLRCMYHGLKFAPSGECLEIPGQSKIPPQAFVRSYPVVEKYSGAWIWMGDPARADESLVPEFVGVDDPRWAMLPGRMDYNANYMLINDNLLDLSHIPFLHRYSLGAQPHAGRCFEVGRDPDGTRGTDSELASCRTVQHDWFDPGQADRHLADLRLRRAWRVPVARRYVSRRNVAKLSGT